MRFPPFAHRTSGSTGDRRRGRSVENAPAVARGSNPGRSRITRSGANGSVAGLAGSVFHGLSTGAIPQNSTAAVGRRWETRGRIVGKQHRRRTKHSCDLSRLDPEHRPFQTRQVRRRLRRRGRPPEGTSPHSIGMWSCDRGCSVRGLAATRSPRAPGGGTTSPFSFGRGDFVERHRYSPWANGGQLPSRPQPAWKPEGWGGEPQPRFVAPARLPQHAANRTCNQVP